MGNSKRQNPETRENRKDRNRDNKKEIFKRRRMNKTTQKLKHSQCETPPKLE